MTDGGGAGAVGGKSLSSLDIIHQETSSSSSLLNNKRNDDDEEDEGRSPLWLIFFCAMSCGSSFRLLTLCNAESASREFSTRLDVRRLALIQQFPLTAVPSNSVHNLGSSFWSLSRSARHDRNSESRFREPHHADARARAPVRLDFEREGKKERIPSCPSRRVMHDVHIYLYRGVHSAVQCSAVLSHSKGRRRGGGGGGSSLFCCCCWKRRRRKATFMCTYGVGPHSRTY